MKTTINRYKFKSILSLSVISLMLAGCNDDNKNNDTVSLSDSDKCSTEYLVKAFDDPAYQILQTYYFKAGESVALAKNPENAAQIADNDVCVAKVLVASETNAAYKDQPSYSKGIGVEVWLPAAKNWDKRIRVKGGGAWVGGNHTDVDFLAGLSSSSSPFTISTKNGSVSATTDTGHTIENGSFAMNPDGSINEKLWKDFAEQGIHEMAVISKLLTKKFYGEDAKFSYWDGFSTGGRQGLKEAQVNPQDFDGILAGAPAINWTKFITNELYPQIVMQRDLDGNLLTTEQLNLVSNRAIEECGVVNNQQYGYVIDPESCKYDPTKDAKILCESGAIENCLTNNQALAVNKIWYGQHENGVVPDPLIDNSFNLDLSDKQKWFGLTRGTNLNQLAGIVPFQISTDLVALILEDSRYAQSNFINKISNGQNLWKTLGYQELSEIQNKGLALQEKFSNINTDNPDLMKFVERKGKLIIYHGLNDELIMPQGTMQYINKLNNTMGTDKVNSFMKAYFIPGMGHSFGNGSSNSQADVALLEIDQLFNTLTNWVENNQEPSTLVAKSNQTSRSLPICIYPKKINYVSGDINNYKSYECK